jgi:hypothetical protein
LRDNFSGLKIQGKSQKHNPAHTSEGATAKVYPPIMLNNHDFPLNIKLHRTAADHDLPFQ